MKRKWIRMRRGLPVPYYDRDGITIYHGDCQEILPKLKMGSVDLVVTSPPYNIFGGTRKPGDMFKHQKSNVFGQWYSDSMPESEYQAWLRGIIHVCLEKTKGLVWVNHKVRYVDREAIHPLRFLPFPLYCEVIWMRSGSRYLNCQKFALSHEGVYGFGKPHYWNKKANKQLTVWRMHQDKSPHPCSFPLELPKRLVFASSRENDVILDPFMGSGTTLKAAKDLGRRCIGIEIEEKYCKIAIKQLALNVFQFKESSAN